MPWNDTWSRLISITGSSTALNLNHSMANFVLSANINQNNNNWLDLQSAFPDTQSAPQWRGDLTNHPQYVAATWMMYSGHHAPERSPHQLTVDSERNESDNYESSQPVSTNMEMLSFQFPHQIPNCSEDFHQNLTGPEPQKVSSQLDRETTGFLGH